MPQEYYGSEPPPGYVSMGNARWVKADTRIAVIGGGPGGLFCTHILNTRFPQAAVTLFEASARLGGKIKTDRFEDGTPFESGVAELYEYLGPGGRDPLRMLIEDDLELRTVDMSGGAVILEELILRDLSEVEEKCGKACRQQIEAFHKTCAKLMPLAEYANRWQLNNAHPWAKKTFREHLHEEVTDPLARRYIECAVHSDLATESWTCNGLNAIKNVLMDNDRYMQLYHVCGGIEDVVLRLAQKVRADVRLRTRVRSVTRSDDKYLIQHHAVRHVTDEFDAVVVCLPNHWLRQVRWNDPELEEAIHEMCAHYDLPAHYLRVSLLYDDRWWDDLHLSGEFWMQEILGNGVCVYDESRRWRSECGHVLSFLIPGGDALLAVSHNQSDEEVVEALLKALPECMREATEELVEAQVDRYIGSINAQPGAWPAPKLEPMHYPCPEECPGVFIVGDYLLDSTLNACLVSAHTAVKLLLAHFAVESTEPTPALKQLEGKL